VSGGPRLTVRGAVRATLAMAPLVGLVPRPEPRPNGITAVVRVRGEEEWIEPCLRSIEGFADEVVVLDNGAGPLTRARVEALRDVFGERLVIERCPELDLVRLSNRGLARARFRWVVRWDADMVAHTSGPADIRGLGAYLRGRDRRRYELVHVAAVEVAGDLRHQLPGMRTRHDGQVVVWSRALEYVINRRTLDPSELEPHDRVLRGPGPVHRALEALRTPPYYRIARWERPAYFHVNVKPPRHMLLRHFWLDWVDAVAGGSPLSHEAYVARRVADEWGVGDLAEAERRYLERYRALLVPFDAAACGPYPELLRPYLERTSRAT
jgi:glycosyltransferase involved in cell wall biosynthesis